MISSLWIHADYSKSFILEVTANPVGGYLSAPNSLGSATGQEMLHISLLLPFW